MNIKKYSKIQFQKYENQIVITIGVLLALYLRFSLRNFKSADFIYFLEPWYDFIVEHGGFSALQYDFANYTPPYLYLMVGATYLFSKLSKVVAIKLISIPFDFLCAYFAYKLVRLRYPKGKMPINAFLAVLFTPTVFLNSFYWGQADIIYTTGLIACIYFLCIKEEKLAFISFGIAFSLKLQALFLAPLLLILLAKKNVTLKSFILIPSVYFLAVLPAYFVGRPLKDLLLIYLNQAGTYKELTKNAPNLYQWVPNQFYNTVVPIGLLLTLSIIFLISFVVYKSRAKINKQIIINLALLSVLFMPYCLPKMHDRYFFPADVISIIFGFYFPNYFFVPITVVTVSIFSYLPFLTGQNIVPLQFLALIMAVIIFIVINHLKQILSTKDNKDS